MSKVKSEPPKFNPKHLKCPLVVRWELIVPLPRQYYIDCSCSNILFAFLNKGRTF